MNESAVKSRAPGVSFAPGSAAMAAISAAAGLDLLLAEMKALAAILPGRPGVGSGAETRPEIPGEDEFDDLPV